MTASIQKGTFAAMLLALAFQVVPSPQTQVASAGTFADFVRMGVSFVTEEPAPSAESVEVVQEVEPTVQEALLAVCEANGYGEDCAKTLLGMLWTESSNRASVIGDNGRARGYFQIHYRLHGISTECAEDIVCSSQWTIDYLERNQYPRYVNYAVQCHNSCYAGNGYTGKVTRYGNYFWDQPLEIEQYVPVELPEPGSHVDVVVDGLIA